MAIYVDVIAIPRAKAQNQIKHVECGSLTMWYIISEDRTALDIREYLD